MRNPVTNPPAVKKPSTTRPSTQPKNVAKPGAKLTTSPAAPVPGKAAKVKLELTGKDGKPVQDLVLLHTQPVHLIAISEDLSDFVHVHPVATGPGRYEVDATFGKAARYKVWTEYQPRNERDAKFETSVLSTAGWKPGKPSVTADSKTPKRIGDTNVALHGAEQLKAGKLATLHFAFTDAITGRPANLQPWLGAAGHAIVVASDLQSFQHLHGAGDGGEARGGHGGHHGGGHADHGMAPTHAGMVVGAGVSFDVKFPAPGTYKLFAQVMRYGEVLTVPFTVAVR